MNALMQVHLDKVRFHAFHGLHAGEEIVGGQFEVSITAYYAPAVLPIQHIAETIDYTIILGMVKELMKKPVALLETLATEIASEIIAKFQIVTEVFVSIFKLQPPIENFQGSVGVTFNLKRH